MGKEAIHTITNAGHSSNAQYYVPHALEVLASVKAYEEKFITKRVPIDKGYKIVKVRLKKKYKYKSTRSKKVIDK